MAPIITRIWHGTTTAAHADAYLRYLEASGLADYKKARYYPGDAQYLLEFEPTVLHCETFEY